MKKFAIIAYIGNYHDNVTECTAIDMEVIKDSNDYAELYQEVRAKDFERKPNGKWYSYTVANRVDARRWLKSFGKL